MSGLRLAAALAVIIPAVAPAQAQTATETGTQFYVKYRAAFDKAKSFDEILPYMSSKPRKDIEGRSADDRKKMFGLVKMMNAVTDVKVVKEEKTPDGATLTVDAIDFAKAKTKGTIKLIRENGAWKVDEESWSS